MSSPTRNNPYKAYSRANHTVPKTKQVVMLYDGVIRNLQQAVEAMKNNDIAERYNKLTRAGEIIIGLQACLDFDQGEETAQILYDFYSSVDSRIINLHRTNDVNVCLHLVAEIKKMRAMWDKIDRGEMEDSPAPSNNSAAVSASVSSPSGNALQDLEQAVDQRHADKTDDTSSIIFNA